MITYKAKFFILNKINIILSCYCTYNPNPETRSTTYIIFYCAVTENIHTTLHWKVFYFVPPPPPPPPHHPGNSNLASCFASKILTFTVNPHHMWPAFPRIKWTFHSLCNVRQLNGMLNISLEIFPKKMHFKLKKNKKIQNTWDTIIVILEILNAVT